MKLPAIIVTILLAVQSFGQVLVNFYPDNTPYPGLTNYPSALSSAIDGSLAPGWATNMTPSGFAAYMAVQTPLFIAASSNYWAPISANYTAWAAIYAQMPLGITDSSNRIAVFTNQSATLNSLWNSWKSGTNNAAGTNVIIGSTLSNLVTSAQQSVYTWTYLNQIIGYLARLGPGFQQIYQPASDPVGH